MRSLPDRAREARARIRSGELRGDALRELLLALPPRDRDVFADVMLALEEAPAEDVDLPRGSVAYLPAGVDAILAVAELVPLRPGDAFVDLGSGLGRVVLLAHLLSGASARGIEIQPHLARAARGAAAHLGLPDVTFAHANAADTSLEGDVFFLYAPFNGPMLQDVLRRLEDVARRHAVVVVTLDLGLDAIPWLSRRTTSAAPLVVYDAGSGASAWGGGGRPRTP